jgi:hypothetical protein
MDESGSPGFPTIHQSVSELECAYSLGKMVEIASLRREKIYFHRYSTAFCGLIENKYWRKIIFLKILELPL